MTIVHPTVAVALRQSLILGRQVLSRNVELRMPLAGRQVIADAGVLIARPGLQLARNPTMDEYLAQNQEIMENLVETLDAEELTRVMMRIWASLDWTNCRLDVSRLDR